MKMRMPAIPLITVDPYFSVWTRDEINKINPYHWTNARNAMRGTLTVDGEDYLFLGRCPAMKTIQQVSVDADAFTTTVVFENEKVRLTALFMSPVMADDLYLSSRPVSYLKLSYESVDGENHTVSAKVSCSEEFVLNTAGEGRACSREVPVEGVKCVRMGSGEQKVLWRSGDNIRIDWGYFHIGVKGEGEIGNEVFDNLYAVYAETALAPSALFLFAYDDIDSIMYFNEPLKAYWKKDGKTIAEAIAEAAADFDEVLARCRTMSDKLFAEASARGGEQYAEMLQLAYRQVMAAHKLVVDKEGKNLFISKECFSNGCAATVDVTYPSAPMFLYYNPELLKGMLRPVYRFARTDAWYYDFAPHDVGRYPLVNGQMYGWREGGILLEEKQMPVEECGNMIILEAAICEAENSTAFAEENLDLLDKWSKYLIEYGEDPANQLCTDDFAGHLSHNCNLSIKAIMGIAGYAKILARLGRKEEADDLMKTAKKYADSFLARAKNPDGSYRLAYDREGTFSLKYNAIWDKIWGTGLFPEEFFKAELTRYKAEALPYGIPLDSREKYTKSDWLIWAACLGDDADFRFIADLLWRAYNTMRTRVPMTDWYYADTSHLRGFQHRTVQGGLFIKLLMK